MRCKRILIRIGTVCQLLAGMVYWDLQLNVGLIALVPTSASPALQHKFNNPSDSSFLPIPSSKFAQCKLLHLEPTPGPPPSLFPLFSYFFFLLKPPPFPFESVNEGMSKAGEGWKHFLLGEVRVGWKAEGAARGQFENRKPCGSMHAGPSWCEWAIERGETCCLAQH